MTPGFGAVIELIDRNIQAKKIDIKKNPEKTNKEVTESKTKSLDKKVKSKK